ncbi:MAG: exosortase/archaeosortase family protein [Myxococcota bacterium]
MHALVASALALCAALALAYGPTLVWDPRQEVPSETADALEGWFFSTLGSAPALTLALAAWLVWNRRADLLAGTPSAGDRALGALLGTGAAALLLWGRHVGAPELGVPSLSLALGAGSLAIGGRSAARRAVFPALFLLLAHPIPVALVNALLYPLQLFTSQATSAVLSLLGVAHLQSGDLIETSQRHFRVIETCSGLRAAVTLLMGGALYLELFGRSRRQAIVILVCAVPLAQLLNLIRVTSIVLIPQSSIDSIHTVQGMVMLFVGMFVIAGIDALEARMAGTRRRRAPRAASRPPAPGAAGRMLAVAAAVLGVWAAGLAVPEAERPPRVGARLFALPSTLDGHTTEVLRLDREYLGALRPSDAVHRRYRQDDRVFEVLVLADEHRDRFDSILSAKAGVIGSGWEILESEPVVLEGVDRPLRRTLQGRYQERAVALQLRDGFAPWPVELLRSALVLDRGPFRRSGRALSVLVSTPVPNEPGGRARAEAELRSFATGLVAALERTGILEAGSGAQR